MKVDVCARSSNGLGIKVSQKNIWHSHQTSVTQRILQFIFRGGLSFCDLCHPPFWYCCYHTSMFSCFDCTLVNLWATSGHYLLHLFRSLSYYKSDLAPWIQFQSHPKTISRVTSLDFPNHKNLAKMLKVVGVNKLQVPQRFMRKVIHHFGLKGCY